MVIENYDIIKLYMNKHFSSKYSVKLYEALCNRGINAILEYPDGHKIVDIAIPEANLFIEVDGIQHFTESEQIMRDFKRSHYSDGDDISTFYVTNQIITSKYFDKVVDALVEVVKRRKNLKK